MKSSSLSFFFFSSLCSLQALSSLTLPPAVETWSLNYWNTTKVLLLFTFKLAFTTNSLVYYILLKQILCWINNCRYLYLFYDNVSLNCASYFLATQRVESEFPDQGQTHAPWLGSMESWPLDSQGTPRKDFQWRPIPWRRSPSGVTERINTSLHSPSSLKTGWTQE